MAEKPDPTALYRDALAAIHEALDVPHAPPGEYAKAENLRHDRTIAVLGALDGLLADSYGPRIVAESLRHCCDTYHPVTYATAQTEAPNHLDICVICGPGCCAPVLGVHTSCPGPAAGATVVAR